MFFSQVPHSLESLSGGSGWVGAGLLGLVLAWLLLKHLPSKDAQFSGLMESKDAQLKSLLDAKDSQAQLLLDKQDRAVLATNNVYAQALADQRSDFRDSLGLIAKHSSAQMASLSEVVKGEFKALETAIDGLSKVVDKFGGGGGKPLG